MKPNALFSAVMKRRSSANTASTTAGGDAKRSRTHTTTGVGMPSASAFTLSATRVQTPTFGGGGGGQQQQRRNQQEFTFIEGPITRVQYPNTFDAGNRDVKDEFAIVIVNNAHTVKGKIPFIDLSLQYRFACTVSIDPQYGKQYSIIDQRIATQHQVKPVQIVVQPLTLDVLASLLRKRGHTVGETQLLIMEMRDALVRYDGGNTNAITGDGVIDLKTLQAALAKTNPTRAVWFQEVVDDSVYFKARYAEQLSLFWTSDALSFFTASQLFSISEMISVTPWPFCFRWMNTFENLPELTPASLWRWRTELVCNDADRLRALPIAFDTMMLIVNMYHKFKQKVKWEKQLRIPLLTLDFTIDEKLALPFACNAGVFRLFPDLTLISAPLYGTMSALGAQLRRIQQRQNDYFYAREVIEQTGDMEIEDDSGDAPTTTTTTTAAAAAISLLPPKCDLSEALAGLQLSDEQLDATQRIYEDRTRVLVIVGDAGTGKTLTSRAIYKMFDERDTLVVAAYGRMAENSINVVGTTAYTIAMAITCAVTKRFPTNSVYGRRGRRRKGQSKGQGQSRGRSLPQRMEPWENIRVLIVEEIGVVTCTQLQRLLSFMPRLQYLIMFGDEKQSAPVEPDAIIHSLLRAYTGTPAFCRLTRNFRAEKSPASNFLIANFRRIADADPQLVYTMDAECIDEMPFFVLRRTELSSTRRTLHECIANDLKILIQRFKIWKKTVQIVTHTKAVRDVINEVAFRIDPRYRNQMANEKLWKRENLFLLGQKVIFRQNYYGSTRESKNRHANLRTSSLSNGKIEVLTKIFDVNPARPDAKTHKSSTIQRKVRSDNRVLVFKNGTQVNTATYPLFKMGQASACTIASEQGEEVDVIIVYVEKNCILNRADFYTAVTRAVRIVVVICDPTHDFATIINREPPVPNYHLAEFLVHRSGDAP